MSLLTPLAAYGIRQVLGDGIEHVAGAVADLFHDHSQKLPCALQRAHERAWRAMEVALAGDGLVDRVKVLFASGDDRGVREQVQTFLRGTGGAFAGTPEQTRQACLEELKRLRRSKLLDQPGMAGEEIAQAAAGIQRYADPSGLAEGAARAVAQVADTLGNNYPHLARLLRAPTPGGAPLLAAAFCFFFRREVETDDELAHGLFFDGLRQLTAAQAKAFIELNKAVGTLGDRFDALIDQLEDVVVRTQSTVAATHGGAVRDVPVERQRSAEVRRQEREHEGQRQEGEKELAALVRQAFERTQGHPTEQDTAAAKILIRRYGIDLDRAKAVIAAVREAWKQQPRRILPGNRPGETTSIDLGGGVAMTFAWCPPGTFLMGSPEEEPERGDDETLHQVTLTQGYWLGVHAVTQKQWQAVMGRNPSHFRGDDLPVENVSWDDCQEFCRKLGEKTGKRFRLPTEAEWEYACRAGTTTPFHFGDTISPEQANCDYRYTDGRGEKGTYRQKTTPVGSFPPNPWGLYDLHGNVLEWCQDWYEDYPEEYIIDPQGASSGNARVLRGGPWNNSSC